jgi:hypothetical protein
VPLLPPVRHRTALIDRHALSLDRNHKGQQEEESMKQKACVGAVLVMLAVPAVAEAQGIPGGAANGFREGGRIAGPVGAVVGTAVGGVIGGIEGVLGIDHDRVAYSDGDTVRPRHYRVRKASRGKHARRGQHARRAGHVTR